LGSIFAGFHYDLNFLTIHGKSRYPGLFIWLRNGRKCPVRVPDGCLLLQAGKQLEFLTGGEIVAGFHEVVVWEETLKVLEKVSLRSRITNKSNLFA
jgi:isopenicillin N synthase-like dioxygenase